VVPCRLFDADARFKRWDSVFICLSSSAIGIGSSRHKAQTRARCHASADGSRRTILISGCFIRAIAEHGGRSHVMAVTVPRTGSSPEVICFSFDNCTTRDSFIDRLQVCADFALEYYDCVLGEIPVVYSHSSFSPGL
jgi:hypothetical protein